MRGAGEEQDPGEGRREELGLGLALGHLSMVAAKLSWVPFGRILASRMGTKRLASFSTRAKGVGRRKLSLGQAFPRHCCHPPS